MIFDFLTITICCFLLLLALITPLCNGFFRSILIKWRICRCEQHTPTAFSIIITAHDKAKELERNLPSILNQIYDSKFEVIVVDESSTDGTDDVLKRLKNEYHNLYTTFIPESSHYLSRRKLALTIGIKAAKNEWLILTDADCRPTSNTWLQSMSDYCNNNTDIVLGFTNYSRQAKTYYRFERLHTFCYLAHKAYRDIAYRYNGNNLAIRKSIFMKGNGFLRNLKYLRGEYDFLVNEYSEEARTAVAVDEKCFVYQDSPSSTSWKNEHLYYMETRQHLKRSFGYRLLTNTDTTLLHFNYLIDIAALTYSILSSNIIMTITAAFCLILSLVLRIIIAQKAFKVFKERINCFMIPFMEIRILWQNIHLLIRHKFADKYEFQRK